MAQRYCTNCGNELGPNDVFCAKCGKSTVETAALSTSEANVDVPPPPTQQAGGAPSFAPAPAEPRQGQAGGCLRNGIIALLITIVVLAVLVGLAGGGGGSGSGSSGGDPDSDGGTEQGGSNVDSGGGGGDAASNPDDRGATEDQYDSNIDTFTRANYGILVANPNDHAGAEVDVVGQLLDNPESDGDEVAFQMWADPNRAEWSTIVHADGGSLGLRTDNYVRVQGEVLGEMEGENAFGGTVTAVEVDAYEVERVEAVEAIDPTQRTVEVGQTKSNEGFSVTIDRLELGAKHTRAYVTARNNGSKTAKLDLYRSKIVQGEDGISQKDPYDYNLPKPKSGVQPGDETEGVVIFGRPDPSEPFQVSFAWERGGYTAPKPDPLVFQITP